ncbi:MAG TPA: sensor histidine kinase [Candidatus Limnocylindrales bacterium]|nr:sensor histidine kinase [Candidatus Limnocylindrales bacterium]
MTIPTSTSATDAADPGLVVTPAEAGPEALVPTLAGRLVRQVARLWPVPLWLDLGLLGLNLLVFAQVAPPEVVFHAIFVLLVLHAFLFGLRGTLWRIGIVSVVLLGYSAATTTGAPLEPMDLSEWPLMFVIAVLVALMAERSDASVRHYASLFRRASDRLLAVQEDERRRFARELHDGVGQTLTALSLSLEAAHDGIAVGERIASAQRLAQDALVETHDLASRLRPARLEQLGLARALADLAGRVGCTVQLRVEPAAGHVHLLQPGAAVEVYRIVQEALSNAARHSGAASADVELTLDRQVLRVVIDDRGCGFELQAARDGGLGLAGMRERAALLGADLAIVTAPGAGTRITLEVPVEDAAGAVR